MAHSNLTDIEVIVIDDPWTGSVLPERPAPQQERHSTRSKLGRWPIWSAAALFTIALHTLLLGTLILGSAARKHQSPMTEGASAQNSDATEFISQLILIKEHSITTRDTPLDADYAVSTPTAPEPVPSPDFAILSTMPQVEVVDTDDGAADNAKNAVSAGDTEGRAMLFGRYMGQIKARIERAWNYPTNKSLTSFRCMAQIKQSKQGEVQEVTFQQCNNDPAWQLSLAKAIQAASPLSAPPDESVFSEIITLSFSADVPDVSISLLK